MTMLRNQSLASIAKAHGLTPAEARVADIIARGISTKQAARELKRSHETVRHQNRAR